MNLIAGKLLDAGFGYQTVFSIVGTCTSRRSS